MLQFGPRMSSVDLFRCESILLRSYWAMLVMDVFSRPFVERLIGTVRREYLDRVFFWNSVDLTRKLLAFQNYYNAYRVHRSFGGTAPDHGAGLSSLTPATLDNYAWQ